MDRRCFWFLTLIAAPFFSAFLFAQNTSGTSAANIGCGFSQTWKSSTGSNIFSEQQEEWLAEIMDKDIRKDFNVIDDPDGYLQKLGEKLLA